jgi:hypothetical protein
MSKVAGFPFGPPERPGRMGKKRNAKDFAPIVERLTLDRVNVPDANASHLATIAEQIDAIGRGDFDAALLQAAPDVELEIYAPREFPFIRHARGVPELRPGNPTQFRRG